MRVPSAERQASAPPMIVVGALILAIFAVVLLHAATRGTPAPSWGVPPAAGFAASSGASGTPPSPLATPAPIHARVGIQVGHWQSAALPDELAVLRAQTGAQAAGLNEVDLNLALARQVVALLAARGIAVDLLPATVPVGYVADAFVAIHCDYNNDPGMGGFKLARFYDSAIPARDDALVGAITAAYGAATGQRPDSHITRAMVGYYAFNSGDFDHAIAPQTPGVIIELGFMTNAADRALLVGQQPTVAGGLADGIIRFLSGQ